MAQNQGQRVVVAGASLAGVRGAEALRRAGFAGRITLAGAESHFPPYDRPPLSKQVLAGARQAETGRLRLGDGLDLELMLGRSAVHLDLAERVIQLDSGATLPFDGLMVATGATPRNPWADSWTWQRGVHTLRTVDDCLRLKDDLRDAARVAIVGAGFIGCEVAATCRGLGLDVTVIDILPQPMLAALGPQMAAVVAGLHRSRDVRLALGRRVLGPVGHDRVKGVLLDGDELVEADVVVIAVGVTPQTRWLEGCGLDLSDGVICDAGCVAAGTDTIVAAGDVARWTHPLLGVSLRVEHWTNAVSQAQAAARNLAARLSGRGDVEPYADVPYVWSDQYDWKLQFVGFPAGQLGGEAAGGGDRVTIEEGAVADGRFVAAYHRDGRLAGALCVNWPAQVGRYRRRILAELAGTGKTEGRKRQSILY